MATSVLVKLGKKFKFLTHTDVKEVVIANGETVSTEVDFEDYKEVGIMMPAAFTGTAITFQASDVSEGTFYEVRNDAGTAVSIVVAPERVIGIATVLKRNTIGPLRFVKLVSGTTETAARTIKLILKR